MPRSSYTVDLSVERLSLTDMTQEANLALPKAPILFTKPRSALIGPYPAAVNIPKCAQDNTSDYEAELCLVIGKTGRDISEENALDYVLGYTASNDVSARTMQMITSQWSFSKGLDSSCPIGECTHGPRVIRIAALKLARPRPCFDVCDPRPTDIGNQGIVQRRRGTGWPHEVSVLEAYNDAFKHLS